MPRVFEMLTDAEVAEYNNHTNVPADLDVELL
jgi:hypothetical protein